MLHSGSRCYTPGNPKPDNRLSSVSNLHSGAHTGAFSARAAGCVDRYVWNFCTW